MYMGVDVFASAVVVAHGHYWGSWPLLELRVKAGCSWGTVENRKTSNVAYAIAFPLASIPEDLYSFTCCPDSSVVERHLGKMEVPGSIPGRGSDKPVSSEAGFFVSPFCLPKPGLQALSARLDAGYGKAPEKNSGASSLCSYKSVRRCGAPPAAGTAARRSAGGPRAPTPRS